jgi:hypothetical protein
MVENFGDYVLDEFNGKRLAEIDLIDLYNYLDELEVTNKKTYQILETMYHIKLYINYKWIQYQQYKKGVGEKC